MTELKNETIKQTSKHDQNVGTEKLLQEIFLADENLLHIGEFYQVLLVLLGT
jgi:hypothetical protein